MHKAIIFDFDGVIVLSEHARFGALQRISKRYGVVISDSIFRSMNGRTTKDIFKLNFPDLEKNILENILQDYRTEHKDKILDQVTPVLFTNEFIYNYSGDTLLAVASGSDIAVLNTLLRHLRLHDKFALIVGKEHVSKHKPDPETYLYTARMLGVTTAECVVVEDSVVGAQAAISAGMKVFALLNGTNAKRDFSTLEVEGFISDLAQMERALKP